MSTIAMLTAWGRPEFNYYFLATKPLDHWPFRQQATKQSIVSPEVTMGGVESDVHTTQDGRPDTILNL